jgi:hypothetical protein
MTRVSCVTTEPIGFAVAIGAWEPITSADLTGRCTVSTVKLSRAAGDPDSVLCAAACWLVAATSGTAVAAGACVATGPSTAGVGGEAATALAAGTSATAPDTGTSTVRAASAAARGGRNASGST